MKQQLYEVKVVVTKILHISAPCATAAELKAIAQAQGFGMNIEIRYVRPWESILSAPNIVK